MPNVIHDNSQYANNRAEQSHEATTIPLDYAVSAKIRKNVVVLLDQ
jgi:hypothetical protein